MRISDWSSDVCSSDLQQLASEPRKFVQIGGSPRHRPHRQRIDNQARLEARLDNEQPSDLFQHHHHPKQGACQRRKSAIRRRWNMVNCKLIRQAREGRSEEHTSELQSLMRISYAVFCLKKKKNRTSTNNKACNNKK